VAARRSPAGCLTKPGGASKAPATATRGRSRCTWRRCTRWPGCSGRSRTSTRPSPPDSLVATPPVPSRRPSRLDQPDHPERAAGQRAAIVLDLFHCLDWSYLEPGAAGSRCRPIDSHAIGQRRWGQNGPSSSQAVPVPTLGLGRSRPRNLTRQTSLPRPVSGPGGGQVSPASARAWVGGGWSRRPSRVCRRPRPGPGFHRPSRVIVAGTSRHRTMVASIATPPGINPICSMLLIRAAKHPNTITMSSAAEVMIQPVCCRPRRTAASVRTPASTYSDQPSRRYS
jgi:hypothetical protein